MVSIYESLEKLGLTRNEVTIYKYLLRKGLSSGAQIWGENSMDKSSAYRAIGQLQEKRLVYAIGETRNQKFAANPVEYLYELHQKVENQLSDVKTDIQKFVEDINEYAKENYKSSRIQLYEGSEGYRLFLKQRIHGSVDLIRIFGAFEPEVTNFETTMERLIKDRVKKGIPVKMLFGKEVKQLRDSIKTNKDQLKEARKIDHMLTDFTSILTHGDSTSIYTQEDGRFLGIVIKDRIVNSMVSTLFDVLWEQGKEV